ncbi:YhjD/YihY/BrkB family envelope integrity protein [Streptomyces sp. NPDC002039]|uniref:YhjD/YihY/BrkB family envelope integrity protein n=1 Tax=unclassified Streptomyces TaxID=2593676 RepID=UPI00332387A6
MSWKERLRGLRARTEERFPVVTELTGRLLSTNLLDGATRLASQAFLASVPLLFAVAAFAPQGVRDQLRDSLRTVFGLTGQADAQLQQVLGSSTGKSLRETTGTIGLLMALISATSFSRAMARVCERAWQLPKSRTRIAVWRWFAWLLALLLVVFMEGPIREGFGAGLWVGIPLSFLLGVGVWLWTQHLFLAGRIGWMALLPGAVLSSIATTVLSLSAALYMPNALNRALHEYGSLGLVLTLLSWLIAICAAVTFAVTIGAVLAREPPLNRFLTTDRRTP